MRPVLVEHGVGPLLPRVPSSSPAHPVPRAAPLRLPSHLQVLCARPQPPRLPHRVRHAAARPRRHPAPGGRHPRRRRLGAALRRLEGAGTQAATGCREGGRRVRLGRCGRGLCPAACIGAARQLRLHTGGLHGAAPVQPGGTQNTGHTHRRACGTLESGRAARMDCAACLGTAVFAVMHASAQHGTMCG